jgi:putative acetyltransferase
MQSIRQYKESDLDAVLLSWEDAVKIAHPFLKQEFLDTQRYNIPSVYLPNTDTWVAEAGGEVVGFIALMGNEAGAIFLMPEFHGQGIGKALIDKAQDIHETLEVEVFKANSIERKFYSQYGFNFLSESIHEPTGQTALRLKFQPK